MSKFTDWIKDQDYLILLPWPVGLVWICWPIGAWHQWSFFWLTITIFVLIAEAVSKFWSPDKDTISNVMRNYRKQHPVIFWCIMTLWLIFCWVLIVHLAT